MPILINILLIKENKQKITERKMPVITDMNNASSANKHSRQPLDIRSEKVPIDQ
ncbi:hypothetical protein J2795_004541 [Chryseobacterium bernardetii]|uniref:Uncharacterized protein n=2 Tax=Chryseobacterium TaxID=59732 RepID=A0ACC6J164_9FLAO|nr:MULTISPECIES: hypothetical protein [Chryseobacterium]MDR6372007.1 hypothetical protein [Chryseobacterium vietnamense]MDR6443789.1 hypothetical protein [Chryseobacterium bernardetii]MDR6461462.1 hypothetical protein [Chryseobacterium vietnamense]MDR6488328.1 hypothetical protein [Chryseobacterium vietnamense]